MLGHITPALSVARSDGKYSQNLDSCWIRSAFKTLRVYHPIRLPGASCIRRVSSLEARNWLPVHPAIAPPPSPATICTATHRQIQISPQPLKHPHQAYPTNIPNKHTHQAYPTSIPSKHTLQAYSSTPRAPLAKTRAAHSPWRLVSSSFCRGSPASASSTAIGSRGGWSPGLRAASRPAAAASCR